MPKQAIDVVLATFRQPSTFYIPKQGMLPGGMLDIIKAAAGDETTIQVFSDFKHTTPTQVKSASQFYLQKLLTTAGDDHYRMLGLDEGATAAEVKDHKRWLLKWLHPDRNPSKWESTLFAEVGKAAKKLAQVAAERSTLTDSSAPAAFVKSTRRKRMTTWTHAKRRHPTFSFVGFFRSMLKSFGLAAIFAAIVFATINRYLEDGPSKAEILGFLKW